MFDPYYTWLGIPPKDQPPTHYRVLGLDRFESNLDVIENAANRQMSHVRNVGQHREQEQAAALNRLSIARVCLLDTAKRQQYDRMLRETSRIERAKTFDSRPPMPGPTKLDHIADPPLADLIPIAEIVNAEPIPIPPTPRPRIVPSPMIALNPFVHRRAPRSATQYQFYCGICERPTLHTRPIGYQVPHWFHLLMVIVGCIFCGVLAIMWLPIWVLHTLINLFEQREAFRCSQCGQAIY